MPRVMASRYHRSRCAESVRTVSFCGLCAAFLRAYHGVAAPRLAVPLLATPRRPMRPTHRTGALALLVLAMTALAGHSQAAAQCIPLAERTEACTDADPPSVHVQPESGSYANPPLPITVNWSDESPTEVVWTKWNGMEVGAFFEVSQSHFHLMGSNTLMEVGRSTGTVQITPGMPNTFEIRICDKAAGTNPGGRCTTVSRTYALAPEPGVEVTPKGTSVSVPASAGTSATRTFTVKNTGGAAATFQIATQCRDASTGLDLAVCSATSSVTLGAGASQGVVLTYSRPSAGMVVLLQLRATQTGAAGVTDAGWVDVSLYHGGTASPGAPVAVVADLNGTENVDRSQCVTVAVGPGAAYECGDLRAVHALPAHRTKGRTWAPVLLYNNQHAAPRPTVHVDVTLPGGVSTPDQVQVALVIGGETLNRYFRGSDFLPGATRRVAVQWNTTEPTGVYPFQLQVVNHYGSTTIGSSVVQDSLTVVNRSGSPFGAGWWWAGLETIQCIDCGSGGNRVLWVGGDGSTRIFEPEVPGQWTEWHAPRLDGPPDTLRLTYPGGVARYTRVLRGGGEVHFDHLSRHVRTVNRLGQVTTFGYPGTGTLLTSVTVPSDSAAPSWSLVYNGSNQVTSIQALVPGQATRTVTLGRTTGNRIDAITNPDQKQVRFGYGSTLPSGWIANRWSQDDARVQFSYAATGKLSSVRTFLEATATADDPITRFIAAEGVAAALRSDTTYVSASLATVYTRIDGPRTDVTDHTYVWPGVRGAPVRVRDALGAETIVVRDATHPAAGARGDRAQRAHAACGVRRLRPHRRRHGAEPAGRRAAPGDEVRLGRQVAPPGRASPPSNCSTGRRRRWPRRW
jgi:hypothetical protein